METNPLTKTRVHIVKDEMGINLGNCFSAGHIVPHHHIREVKIGCRTER